MDVVDLWRAKVSTHKDDILVRNYYYEHVVASSLGLAIDVEDMRILMHERTTANWEQLQVSQISFEISLHTLLDDFGVTPPAARRRISSAFAILPMRAICYLAEAV